MTAFKVVKNYQEQINEEIKALSTAIECDESYTNKNYLNEQEKKINAIKALPLNAPWPEYLESFGALKIDLVYLSGLKTPSRENERALLWVLEASKLLLNNAINRIGIKLDDSINPRLLAAIFELQQEIEKGLNFFLPDRTQVIEPELVFSQLNMIELKLANLEEDYETTYKEQYNTKWLGFFSKLDIKVYFRQSSRKEELQFIKDIENYIQRKEAELSEQEAEFSDQESIKLNALNLVRLKIGSERFGERSQLKRLIETRLYNAQQEEHTGVAEDFIDFCDQEGIRVPSGLRSYFENELMHARHQI